jgi:isocitrate dehydrogenase
MANPSGLLQGAIMMLNHIGQTDIAEKVQNAWLKTIESGVHTYDIYKEGVSKEKVGTKEFAKAVISNLGQKPTILKSVHYSNNAALNLPKYNRKPAGKKELVGVDVFVHWGGTDPNELAAKIKAIELGHAKLSMITNRGIKVWPDGFKETFCTDHWRCRFKPLDGATLSKADIIKLLENAESNNIDSIKTENLYAFDDRQAYSLGQGQ